MRQFLIATSKILAIFMQSQKFSTVPEVSGLAFSAELDSTELPAIWVFKYLWKHFAQGLGRLDVFVVKFAIIVVLVDRALPKNGIKYYVVQNTTI